MRRGAVIFILSFTFLFSGIFSKIRAQVIAQDSLALIDFFVATSGNDWLIPWDTTKSVNEWFGVILTEDNFRVEGIALPNNQLAGQLPVSISNLKSITSLDLSDNQIAGKIIPEIAELDTLIILDLSGNLFTDTIPTELGLFQFLKTLDLNGNDLQGEIPVSLGNLDSLRNLNLSQNELTGVIPNELGGLDSLNTLNVSFNKLLGPIPAALGNLKVVREMDLSSNGFEGPLPVFWNELTNLRTLLLDNNLITGNIPSEIGALNNLFTLDISFNQLEGTVPVEIGNLDSLRTLDLSDNFLTTLALSTSNLTKLQRLDLSMNSFAGPLPSLAGSLNNLKILDLHGNLFAGVIPGDYSSLTTLEEIDLSGNSLTDSLPGSFLNLFVLKQLNLSDNKLSVLADFSTLGTSGNLQKFDVSNNELGFDDLELNFSLFGDSTDYSPQARVNDTLNVAVPTGNSFTLTVNAAGTANQYRWVFESFDSLVQLSYSPDNFDYIIDNFQEINSGTYTCEIINGMVPGLTLKRNPINLFPAINTIDSLALIQFNKSTGGSTWDRKWDIQSQPVFTWEGVDIESGTVVGLELENNNLKGILTDSIGLLTNLRVLELGGNGLEDTIPSVIGNMSNLTILNLSNNNLIGRIPDEIRNLDSLRIIDLSRNRLDSTLTTQFDSLQSLTDLNLSDNDLTGNIPPNLSSLVSLKFLALGDNRFTGDIPIELGLLSELINLDLSENRLIGLIPVEIALLPNLEELKLFRNQLTGALPSEFTNSAILERLFVNDNQLSTLPVFSSTQFNNLELRVFNNVLTFDDLVDNFNGFNSAGREDEFLFLPQPTIIDRGTLTVENNQSITLEIDDSHPDNKYRWLKGGASLEVDTRQLSIDSAQISSSGIYLGQVWTANPNFTDEFNSTNDSLIFTYSFTVLVPPPIPQVQGPEPFCVGNETITLRNDFGGEDGLVSRWYTKHPDNGGIPFSENPSIVYVINSESDTVFVTNGLQINKSFESSADTVIIISRPWIVDKGDFLEAAPSDSLLNTRFTDNPFTSSYQWFINEVLVPGETGIQIQKSVNSEYHVRVIRGGCSSTSLSFIPPAAELVLGYPELEQSEISIYPNPVNNILKIDGLQKSGNPVEISIINVSGSLVYQKKGDRGFLQNEFDLSALNRGMYFLRIRTNKGQFGFRLVKN